MSKQGFAFERPKVKGKVVLAKGPSGWMETFQREAIDNELVAYVAPALVDELVDLYVDQRATSEHKGSDWFTITGFLGRMLNMHPGHVSPNAALAFWARVLVCADAQNAN